MSENNQDLNNKQNEYSESSDYEFIREKIKERPISRRRVARRMILTAGSALLFGIIACVTFLILEPRLGSMINKKDKNNSNMVQVVLPEVVETDTSEVSVVIDDTPYDVDYEETPIENLNLVDTVSTNETASSNEVPVIVQNVELGTEEYHMLGKKMYALSLEVGKSIVTVSRVSIGTDALNDNHFVEKKTTGLIIAENGFDVLIVADYSTIEDVESTKVTFADGSSYDATIKSVDEDTGLAVYAVKYSSISESTKSSYRVATFGYTAADSICGIPVLAVGDPLKTGGSLCQGMITSNSIVRYYEDSAYTILTTDIYGSTQASGVLVNMRGQVVGVITSNRDLPGMNNLVVAYGISSIRDLMQNMSNGKKRPHTGLYIEDVSEAVRGGVGIPEGVYVTKVDLDSPAMNVGIMPGDVITAVGEEPIMTVAEYMNKLKALEPGDEIDIEYKRLSGGKYVEMNVTLETQSN